MRLDEEAYPTAAGRVGTTARREGGCGRVGVRRRFPVCSGVVGESDRGGVGDEGECEGVPVGGVELRETSRGGGGSQAGRRWPGRVAARAGLVPVLLAGRKTTGEEAAVGWAVLGRLVAPGKWLGCWWATR